MRRMFGLGLAAVLLLSGCGETDPLERNAQQDDALVVGSSDLAESELLMEIYAEALRTTGAEVRTQGRIGARETYVNAVRNGEITVFPEYTGNLLKFVDPRSRAGESRQVYEELQAKLPRQLEVLDQSRAEDSDVLAVTAKTAEATGVRSMADLAPHCPEFVLGAPAEWKPRWKQEIARTYGCQFKDIRSVEAGTVTVDALTANRIQVANLFTTSSAFQQHDLVKLDDPKDMYPAQNVVPLVHAGELDQHQREVLNEVSGSLTTDQLAELNRKLEVDKANPADLAKSVVDGMNL